MVIPGLFRRRSGGWARNYGAAGETHEKRNSQNEPGMCLGINRLTFWCFPQIRSPRLANIAKSAIYAQPEAGFGCTRSLHDGLPIWNVSWNQSFHKVRAYRVGEYLY